MAQTNDITVYKGEDITIPFAVVQTLNGVILLDVNGQPLPLVITGWALKFTVRKLYTDVTPLFQITPVITDGPNGKFTVTMPSSDTVSLQAKTESSKAGVGEYHYDVQRTDAGSHAVLSIGKLTILQEVLVP